MTVRKTVPVTIALAGGVKTIEDVEGQLETLPDLWEVTSIGTPEVQVAMKVPLAVPDEDVTKHIQGLMASLDFARDEAEEKRQRKEAEASATQRIKAGL